MKKECAFAEECVGCGEQFDLSYDLGGARKYDAGEVLMKMARIRNGLLEHLCWGCRIVQ